MGANDRVQTKLIQKFKYMINMAHKWKKNMLFDHISFSLDKENDKLKAIYII